MKLMLFMRYSKHKKLLIAAFGILVVIGVVLLYWWARGDALLVQPHEQGQMVTVTIPDGLRKEQTADILGKALSWSETEEQKFVTQDTARDIRHVEGVFPGGTYNFSTASSTYEIASVLLDAADERHQRLGTGLTPDEWYEVLKVAAIAEKEITTTKDKNRIARTMWTRLRSGSLLESLATVEYVRDSMAMYASKPCVNDEGNPTAEGMVEYPYQGTDNAPERTGCIHWRLAYEGAEKEYNWWQSPTDEDLKLEHGYNTFLYTGLPSHPIATPSEESIIVALDTRTSE